MVMILPVIGWEFEETNKLLDEIRKIREANLGLVGSHPL